jgi:mono/diheme cytochrome c family protein
VSKLFAYGALGLLALAACRGDRSEDPPVHLIRNMINQPRFDPQAESELFADKRTMRPVPANTIAQGSAKLDDHLSLGKAADGTFAKGFPFEVDTAFVKRGQERYNIYCTPCHGPLGVGNGIVTTRGFNIPPTNLHEERIRNMPEGEIFNVITNGVRNMPAYSTQVPLRDRWAIVSYVRALERSQNAKIDDVPENERSKLATKAENK